MADGDNKIVGIRPDIIQTAPAETEVDPELLSVAQQLVDRVKSGQVTSLSWVTVGRGDEPAVTAFKLSGFYGMPLLGALDYVKYRIAMFIDS